MPYRSPDAHEADRVYCHRHPADRANVACHRCLQPLCDACSAYFDAFTTCIPCKAALRRRRTIVRVLGVVGALAIVVGFVALARFELGRFDYGVNGTRVRLARNRVDQERCDKEGTLALDQVLFDSGDYRGVLTDAAEYTKTCGDWFRTHWLTYESYRRLGDDERAVGEATQLIAHDPRDADYRWWRAVAYEALALYAEAERDYRDSIRLEPTIRHTPANLANVLERQGKICDAKRVLDTYLHALVRDEPGVDSDGALMARLARLTNECDD